MLSPKLKEIAEVYALQMIGKEDVEYLLRLNKIHPDHFDDLPKEFHDYVEEKQSQLTRRSYSTFCPSSK